MFKEAILFFYIDTSYNFNDVIDKEVNKIIDKDKEK